MPIKIGDRVCPKKTGCPTVGTVIGIISSSLSQGGGYWDSVYDGWREKSVYIIQFDKPQKIMSLDEYLVYLEQQKSFMQGFQGNPEEESFGQNLELPKPSKNEVLLKYLNDIPYAMNAPYPEDDLEII